MSTLNAPTTFILCGVLVATSACHGVLDRGASIEPGHPPHAMALGSRAQCRVTTEDPVASARVARTLAKVSSSMPDQVHLRARDVTSDSASADPIGSEREEFNFDGFQPYVDLTEGFLGDGAVDACMSECFDEQRGLAHCVALCRPQPWEPESNLAPEG